MHVYKTDVDVLIVNKSTQSRSLSVHRKQKCLSVCLCVHHVVEGGGGAGEGDGEGGQEGGGQWGEGFLRPGR